MAKPISTGTGKITRTVSVFQAENFGSVNLNTFKHLDYQYQCFLVSGLENLYQLTSSNAYILRIELVDWDGKSAFAEYRSSIVIISYIFQYSLIFQDCSSK